MLACCCHLARAASQQTYLHCLTNFETYAESIWHPAVYAGAPPDAGYWGDGGSTGNGGIRGNSGVAVAYAVLVIAAPNDPKATTRLARIRQALNYDYQTHVTGSNNTVAGNQWGWSTDNLSIDGTLAVALGAVQPQIARIALDETALIWSGSGGAAGASFSVLSSTNLNLPVTNWSVIGSRSFDSNGNFAVTNFLSPASPNQFYAIRIP